VTVRGTGGAWLKAGWWWHGAAQSIRGFKQLRCQERAAHCMESVLTTASSAVAAPCHCYALPRTTRQAAGQGVAGSRNRQRPAEEGAGQAL
jgi:hypothetical protein